jgi:2-polyprenyl-6-methoxyphenol hydroxylase-like FAD-dependent oxidoreductase
MALPPSVRRITGKAAEIVTSDGIQTVRLSDGTSLKCRVVVMATGQSHAVARQAGIERQVLRAGHSLTFGFDIGSEGGGAFPHPFVVYQRESIRDRIDYLTAFTLGATTRVNLFTYRDYKESWTRDFIADPTSGLKAVLPQLQTVIGPYRAMGQVSARPIDLYVAKDYRKDGVVLIGDVFQASCPATGMGMVRLLTDIERLTNVHLPKWLQTPGMGAAKISSFYDDPVKRACDAKALHDSEYRRSLSTDQSFGWALHRARVAMQECVRVWLRRAPGPSIPRVKSPHAAGSLAAG